MLAPFRMLKVEKSITAGSGTRSNNRYTWEEGDRIWAEVSYGRTPGVHSGFAVPAGRELEVDHGADAHTGVGVVKRVDPAGD
jgi:hypothetical protein